LLANATSSTVVICWHLTY